MSRFRKTRACAAQSLSAAASSSNNISGPRKLADFEWILFARQAIPSFLYNSTQSEVMFKYSVSGTETGTYGTLKYLRRASFWRIVTRRPIFQHFATRRTEVDEFTVELDILQEFISILIIIEIEIVCDH
jgi:hypothetical protein